MDMIKLYKVPNQFEYVMIKTGSTLERCLQWNNAYNHRGYEYVATFIKNRVFHNRMINTTLSYENLVDNHERVVLFLGLKNRGALLC